MTEFVERLGMKNGRQKEAIQKLLLHIEFESMANADIVDQDIGNEWQYEEIARIGILYFWRQNKHLKMPSTHYSA